MLQVLNITAPIYLLIAAGFVAVRSGVFQKTDMRLIGRLLLLFIMPALVFRAVTRYPLQEVLNLPYLAAYALGSLVAQCLGMLYARSRGYDRAGTAFFGMGFGNSNSVFVGYPIASQVIGPSADVALALCLLVENLLIIPSTLVLADANAQLPWHRALLQSLMGLRRNPIILAIVAGFAVTVLGLPVPELVSRTLQITAGAAAPLALFMIGGVLVGQQLQGVKQDLSAVALGKLLLHPLAVLLALTVLPAPEPPLLMAALLFAAMPLPAVYPALAQKYKLDGFCSTALVLVTVLSFFTLNTWLVWLPDVAQWITRLHH